MRNPTDHELPGMNADQHYQRTLAESLGRVAEGIARDSICFRRHGRTVEADRLANQAAEYARRAAHRARMALGETPMEDRPNAALMDIVAAQANDIGEEAIL